MAIKKSQLYSTLWESANALRGSMDASQYKDYVLMILFVKFLSDKAKQGEELLSIPQGCYFEDFIDLKNKSNIGEQINKKLELIQRENITYIGSIALPNFNDKNKFGEGKQASETLSKLIGVFENDALDFSKNRAADDDLLGDAYEYFMKNFAAESGKSKGQFYTPAEVSRVIAQILHLSEFTSKKTTIYDPTCGSGSLLLRALSETARQKASLFGQEKDNATSTLAVLNMFLHGLNDATIYAGKDTLNNPQNIVAGKLETFDICVANPPFSQKNWLGEGAGGVSDIYQRWSAELLPPAKCGDYAFLLHLIGSMKPDTGRGACILPHGVLFRGNAEYLIRKDLISKHIIKGIIGLPANIFFGTGIPASIIVIDKKDTALRNGIFFIDAKDGYMKDGAKNRLREQDIRRIVDVWNSGQDVPHYARFVTWKEIEDNDYNLNIPRYIQPVDTEITQNIESHLKGGIPVSDIDRMQDIWDVCDTLRGNLFAPPDSRRDAINRVSTLRVPIDQIAATIKNDDSFLRQSALFAQSLDEWTAAVKPEMYALGQGFQPKKLIAKWSSLLLEISKKDKSLVSAYDVYDHLMNYWAETMQDDCYMISNDGFTLPKNIAPKKKNGIYSDIECDLLPVDIILSEYFADETAAIDSLKNKADDLSAQIQTIEEEAQDEDEYKTDDNYKKLVAEKKETQRQLKSMQKALTDKVCQKYSALSEPDIRRLVIENKWIASVTLRCNEEMQRLAQQITASVSALCTRYARPLSEIESAVATAESRVAEHLRQMGFDIC